MSGPDGPQTIDELFERQHQYADAKMWEITGYEMTERDDLEIQDTFGFY
jgi:hypothetical protein